MEATRNQTQNEVSNHLAGNDGKRHELKEGDQFELTIEKA
ncbi:hypothetical protein HAPAU_35400 [Halalkalicoccus paucihalophilus]|uniref:Uncharacterized protein n=1 Tax=Halalkalicoccus paucihalophilus TaxID=1008153 RepID=A0A151AB17_9EURY|nr:hypothetical protein HAPAU_35400 [Halalkalicoccus paucihalophilus]